MSVGRAPGDPATLGGATLDRARVGLCTPGINAGEEDGEPGSAGAAGTRLVLPPKPVVNSGSTSGSVQAAGLDATGEIGPAGREGCKESPDCILIFGTSACQDSAGPTFCAIPITAVHDPL